jgi:hypothetical protein
MPSHYFLTESQSAFLNFNVDMGSDIFATIVVARNVWLIGPSQLLNGSGYGQTVRVGGTVQSSASAVTLFDLSSVLQGGAVMGGTISFAGYLGLGSALNKGTLAFAVDAAATEGIRLDVVNSGTILGRIALGARDDTLVNSGSIFGDLRMGDGFNRLESDGLIQGAVWGGSQDDFLRLGGTVQGVVLAGPGADTVVPSGRVSASVLLGDGNDSLDAGAGGRAAGGIHGEAGNDTLGAGAAMTCWKAGLAHEGEPFEKLHILLILQQGPMKFRQKRAGVAPQVLGGQILGQQQPDPVQHFGCGGALFQAGRFAQFKELRQRRGQQRLLDVREVDRNDGTQRVHVGKAYVVKEAAPQKGVGQVLFVVRGDDHDRAVQGPDGGARFIDVEFHPVEFLQQVIGKLDIGLVHLVDQQDHARRCLECLPQLSLADIVVHIIHPRIAQLAVTKARHGVVFIKPLLRLGGGFDVPFDHRQIQRRGHLPRKFGFACARLALDQKRALQRHGGIHRDREVIRGDVTLG